MNIIEILKKHLEEEPHKLALLHKGKEISYQELDARSRAAAAFFSKHGITHHQRALLFVPLSIELYVLFLALVRSGVTVVLIDPSAGRAHMSACVTSLRPDVFIGVPKAHLLRLIDAVQKIPKKFSTCSWIPGSTLIRYTQKLVRKKSSIMPARQIIRRSLPLLVDRQAFLRAYLEAMPFSPISTERLVDL